MDFPGKEPSSLFKGFVEEYSHILDVRVKFKRMEAHSVKRFQKAKLGLCELDERAGVLKIFINTTILAADKFPSNSNEAIAAHEILHLWLIRNGFPVLERVPGLPADSPKNDIGARLHCMIHHIVIDSKLEELGFNVEFVNFWHGKFYLNRIREADLSGYFPGDYVFVNEVLEYSEGSLRYNPDDMQEVRKILVKTNRRILFVGERCIEIIEKTDCTKPPDALTAMINISSKLGIKERGIRFLDTASGKVY